MPEEPEKKKEGEQGAPKLRTMKYDAANYLKDKNVSFLDLVDKEETRKESDNFSYKPRRPEHLWLTIVIGLIVVVFLGILGYMAFQVFLKAPPPVGIDTDPPPAYVATDGRDIFTIRENDRAGLYDKLRASRNDRLPSRSIKQFVVKLENFEGATRYAKLSEFLPLLGAQPPSDFSANNKDKFNVLLYYPPTGTDIALIVEPKDVEQARTQMIAWERTMILDLNKLYLDAEVPATVNPFQDAIIKNIDARVLTITPTATLSYAIFAQKYLVISTTKEFLEVLISRLMIAPPA
jgi:hypothetical protein